jgi:hypothetical protein
MEDIVYAAETNLSMFSYLMELHEYHQLAFDAYYIPLAVATARDSVVYHMKRFYESLNGNPYFPNFPHEVLHALAQSREGPHKTFEFLISRDIVTNITDGTISDALCDHLMTVDTLDMLLSHSKLTAELAYKAAQNSWESAWRFIKKNEVVVDVSRLLECHVDSRHCGNCGNNNHFSNYHTYPWVPTGG